MEVVDTRNPVYLNKCQVAVPQLQALAADFNRIVGNTALTYEQRYALALADVCYGRLEALFEDLELSLHMRELSPHILGHEVCLHLIGEDIAEKLKTLTSSLAAPA